MFIYFRWELFLLKHLTGYIKIVILYIDKGVTSVLRGKSTALTR